jgi:ABC-type multidrug transport system permease subunit
MNTISIVLSGFVQVFETELKGIDSMMNTPVENVSIPDMTPFMEIGKKKIVALKTYISPLLIKLKQEAADKIEKKKDTGFNISALILPGMAVMFLLFIVEAFVREILTERENGITRRMMFSPLHAGQLVIARIFGGWIMGILVLLVIVVCGTVLFGIHWGNYFFLFLLAAAASFWAASFFALLNSFFKNKNQSAAFTSPIILVFSAFGGSILPLAQIPSPMRWISGFTVNHWFISGAEKIGSGSFPAVSILILLASGLVLFVFAIFSLKRRITV